MARRSAKRKKRPVRRSEPRPTRSGQGGTTPRDRGEAPPRRIEVAGLCFNRSALPLLGLLLVLTGTLTLGYLANEDFWWYLTSGEAILAERGIPDHDVFLYTSSATTPWDANAWLWTVLVALVHRGLGVVATMVFGALVAGTVVVLLFGRAPLDRFGLLNGLGVFMMILVAGPRLSLKSQLATWLLLVVFLYLLDRRAPFTWRTALALAVLQWLWPNLHAGYPLGIAAVLAYSVGGWLEERPFRRRAALHATPPAGTRPPLWLGPALIVLCLLSMPSLASQRIGMARFVFAYTYNRLTSPATTTMTIAEWTGTLDSGLEGAFYALVLVAGCASFVLARRPRRPARLLLFAAMAVLASTAVRHLTAFTVITTFLAISNLSEAKPRGRRRRGAAGRWQRRVVYPAAVTLFAVLVAAMACGLWISRNDFKVGDGEAAPFFAFNPTAACPGAADYVLEHDLPGPIFNDLILGGYLTYRLYPKYQLFVDNRALPGHGDYQEIWRSPDTWRKFERRYGFRTAVLSNLSVPVGLPLRDTLISDPRWQLVYLDPQAAVLVRSAEKGLPQARPAEKLAFLTPSASTPRRWLRDLAKVVLGWDATALLESYLGVLGQFRQFATLDGLATQALERRPGDTAVLRLRGAARMFLDRPEAALEDLRQAVALGADDVDNHLLLARVLGDLDRVREALRVLDEAAALAPTDREVEALRRELRARLGG